MSEEEKEAIEILRNFEPDDLVECSIYIQAVEKITNLIDKLQKEVEDTKQINANLKKEIKLMKSVNINENYISKDKIRELREIDNIDHLQFKIKELLGDDINEN